ncbi:related to CDC14 - dual specificity phosphatase [Moesziomyces antarcticus]|uniref:protein-tyrosine-phosphatase n=1 Tax=Pseudozyma antarctica TaxID=84753 RepID=A0A5C3FXC8_PSEA2|nr:related to CDC14 - dual specificity phosphatase [Moesziomyces antarcticus]
MSSPSAFALAEQQEHIIAPDDSDFLDSDAEGTPHPDDHFIESAVLHDAPGAASSSSSPARRARSAARGKLWPAHPLIRIHKRLWFTWFEASLPNEDELNLDAGHAAAWTNFDDGEVSKYVDAAETKPARLHWFNIDHDLVYLSFWFDWGPLNVGMFYRFCLHVHHMLTDPDMQDATLVLYTTHAPAQKANAALLATLYAMIIGKVSPADAFYPISELEFKPFRDAGYGRADYNLSIQDVLYGVQRAINHGLLDLTTFNLDEYEKYEQVHNGDWNWITPNFIAFASPNDRTYVEALRTGDGRLPPNYTFRPPGEDKLFGRTIRYFKERGVQLVVRLNNPLYDRDAFVQAGIQHADMYFDDGSNPTDDILADFIARADEVIRNDGVVAVHCKAGLGRTGVLIGAYLVWKHGFSAGEAIGFMRFMRPGCVVGPQQHFMYQNFVEWVKWGVRDHALADARKLLAEEKARLEAQYKPSTPPSTTRAVKRRAAGSDAAKVAGDDSVADEDGASDTDAEEHEEVARPRQKHKREADEAPITPRAQRGGSRAVPASAAPGVKPAPCVGQPRKSPSPSRKRPAIQAPATVARLELNTRRYPTGASSFSQHLLRATNAVHVDTDSDLDENTSLDACATGGSTAGVLVEARINVATPLRASPKAAVGTPSPVARVRGFERPRASTVGSIAIATPVRSSSRSPSPASSAREVVRASPGIRDRYGLRDSKSPPPATPPTRTSRHPSPVKIAPLVARVTTDAEVLGVLACIPQTDRASPPKPAPKPVAAAAAVVVDENARAPVAAPKVLRTVRSKPTLPTTTTTTSTTAGVRRGGAGVRSVSAKTPSVPVARAVRAQKSSAELRAAPSSRSVSSSSTSSTTATVSRGSSRLTAPTAASAARAAAAAAQRAKVAPPPAAAAGGVRKVSVLRPQAVRRRRSSTGQADVDLQ